MYHKKRRSLLEDVRQDRASRPPKKVAAHNVTVCLTLILKRPPNLAHVLQKKSMYEVIAAKMELGVESLDSTTAQSVAGQHLATMSDASRATVAQKLNKTVKSARNKAVKQAVLEEEYTTKVLECTVAHLKQSQSTVASMVHVRRKTLFEEEGINAVVKVGDWVQIESDYSAGICSDGGVACITAVHCGLDPCPLVSERCIVLEVAVHYLIYGRRERFVKAARLTVIPKFRYENVYGTNSSLLLIVYPHAVHTFPNAVTKTCTAQIQACC